MDDRSAQSFSAEEQILGGREYLAGETSTEVSLRKK
jgi:hypothetical protein